MFPFLQQNSFFELNLMSISVQSCIRISLHQRLCYVKSVRMRSFSSHFFWYLKKSCEFGQFSRSIDITMAMTVLTTPSQLFKDLIQLYTTRSNSIRYTLEVVLLEKNNLILTPIIYLFIYLFIYSFIYSFVYLFIHSFIYLFTYLSIYLFICLLFLSLFIQLFIFNLSNVKNVCRDHVN